MTTHNSTTKRGKQKAGKPRKDFPLFVHRSGGGRWCKKVPGKFRYFGSVPRDPHGEGALRRWLDEREFLLAGKEPPQHKEGPAVEQDYRG